MKRYENPKMEVKNFISESILTGSGIGTTAMENWQSTHNAEVITVKWEEVGEYIDFTF